MVGLKEFVSVIVPIFCAMLGWHAGGLPGAVLGYVAGAIVIFVPFESYRAIKRRRKWAQLRQYFGEYYARDRQDSWEQTKARLKPGDVVRGVVVHNAGSRVLVDIGCGFPAHLSPPHLAIAPEGPAGDSLETSDAVPLAAGSELEARIIEFVDADREIEITERGRWLLFDGEMIGFLTYAECPIEGRYYLRMIWNEACDAFLKLAKGEETSRCEVLTGDEKHRVSVKKEGFSGYVWVTIRLLQDASSPA